MQIIVETYNNGSPTPEFNNAGQIFNHDFYWESISPEKRKIPRRNTSCSIIKCVCSSSCWDSCINKTEFNQICCERHHAAPWSV